MSRGTLSRIKPLHPELIPPEGSEAAGITADGRQLYRRVRKMSRPVPKYDKEGNRVYRKHAITGEEMYGINQPEIYEEEQLFYLESQGNGNVGLVMYKPPSPEELAELERQQRVEDMKTSLAEALVDGNVTPADLVKLFGGVPAAEEAPKDVEYPINYAPGRWQLSNGTKMQGKKDDALKAEAEISDEEREAVADAKQVAEETPEF